MKRILTVLFFLPLFSNGQLVYEHEESYPLDPNGKIILASRNAKVRIIGEDRNDVQVQITRKALLRSKKLDSDGYIMDIKSKPEELIIFEKKDASVGVVKYLNLNYDILIRMPQTVSLDIKGRDDKYVIDTVAGNLKIDADDGKLEINKFDGKMLDIKIENAPVEIRNGGNGDLKLVMGEKDCKIINSIFTNINLIGGSGNYDIHTRFSDVHNLRFSVEDGELNLTLFGNGGIVDAYTGGGTIESSSHFKVQKKSKGYFQFKAGDGFGKLYARTRDGKMVISKKEKGE